MSVKEIEAEIPKLAPEELKHLWAIIEDGLSCFAMLLIGQARKLYVDHPIDVDLDAAGGVREISSKFPVIVRG